MCILWYTNTNLQYTKINFMSYLFDSASLIFKVNETCMSFNLTGKENVYINVGIDKVPIITLEETGSPVEGGLSEGQAPERPALPVKTSNPYENARIHEMTVKELAYVVSENSKDNNKQLKEQFKVSQCSKISSHLKEMLKVSQFKVHSYLKEMFKVSSR